MSGFQATSAEQCNCSDSTCVSYAAMTGNSTECCLWDFPPNGPSATEVEEMGYAVGWTTMEAPHFCITYPIPDRLVHKMNYFLVKLDLSGPAVW